jgi:hypothetical protein
VRETRLNGEWTEMGEIARLFFGGEREREREREREINEEREKGCGGFSVVEVLWPLVWQIQIFLFILLFH